MLFLLTAFFLLKAIAKIRIIFDMASIFGEDRLLEDTLKLFLTVFTDIRPVIVNVAI